MSLRRSHRAPTSDAVLWRQLSPSAPKFPPVLGEEASNALTCAEELDDFFFVKCGTMTNRYVIYNEFSKL